MTENTESDEDLPLDEILNGDEAAPETVVESGTSMAVKARTIGFKTLVTGMIAAALMGASGGTVLSTYFNKPIVDIKPLQSKADAAQNDIARLKTQITRLDREVKSLRNVDPVNTASIENRLDVLETGLELSLERLESLRSENLTSSALTQSGTVNIDPELVARLEALAAAGGGVLELSDVYRRLTALENIVENQATNQATHESEIDYIEDTFEDMPDNVSLTTDSTNLISDFPKADILTAIENIERSKNWVKRILNKHISVRSEDDPRNLVEAIIAHLDTGDIDGAIEKFDQLPSQARSAGRAWRVGINDYTP